MIQRIVVAVGSTGGHFFPGFRVARHLRKNYGIETIFAGPIKKEFQAILKGEKFPFNNLPISTGQKNIITTIFFYYLAMLKAAVKSFLFLRNTKPALVIGTGSFGSFPTCILAYLLKIPLFIQEQNVVPGKANIFLGKFAEKIFLAFPGSFFQTYKTLVVGNPIEGQRADLSRKECYEKFGLDMDKKTLLIFGGSQGAFSLNSWFISILDKIAGFSDWQIIHIAGKSDYERVKNRYASFKIRSVVLPFLYPIDCAYRISDLAVSRGGALSLSELSFWGIPALIVPYSYAKDNHQKHNAVYFREKKGVYLFNKGDIQKDNLPKILRELLTNPRKLKLMSDNIKKVLPNDALEKMCKEIYKYIK